MAKVHFVDETGSSSWVPVGPEKPEISVGRHASCEIRTSNNTVSRRHARIVFRDGTYAIEDLNSSNGTFFGGARIQASDLQDGDVFLCGNFEMRFELDGYERHEKREGWGAPEPVEDVEQDYGDRIEVAYSSEGYEDVGAQDVAAQDEFAPRTLAGFISKKRESQADIPVEPVGGAQVVDLDGDQDAWHGLEDEEGILLGDDIELNRMREEAARLRADLKTRDNAIDRMRIELDSLSAALESTHKLERDLEASRGRTAELDGTIRTLRATLSERDDQMRALDEHVIALEGRLEQSFAALAEPHTNPEGPTLEELQETTSALEAKEAELLAAAQALEQAQATLRETAAQRDAATSELEQLRREIADLPAPETLAEVELERDELAKQLRARPKPADLDALRDERNHIAEGRDRAMAERDEAISQVRALKGQLEQANQSTDKTRDLLEQQLNETRGMLEVARDDARRREEELRKDLEGARVDRERGDREVQRLEELVKTATQSAERALELVREENAALRRAQETAAGELQRVKEELLLARGSASELAKVRRELEKALAAVEDQAELTAKAREELDEARDEQDAAQQEIDQLRAALDGAASADDLGKAEARIADAEAALREARESRDEAVRAREELESQLQAERTAREGAEAAAKAAADSAEALRKFSGGAEDAKKKLERALEDAKRSLADRDSALQAAEQARREANEAAQAARDALDAARQSTGDAATQTRQLERELATAQRKLADAEHAQKELAAENENLKLGHKAQTRRVSQLLNELRSARGDRPTPPPVDIDPAELDAAVEARATAERERDAALSRLTAAERDAAQAADRLDATEQRLRELEATNAGLLARIEDAERKAEAAPSAPAPVPAANGKVVNQIRNLFDRVNDLASVWRNNMTLIDDFVEEMHEEAADPTAREEVLEQLGVAVTSCRSATREMKDALREVRKVLNSEG